MSWTLTVVLIVAAYLVITSAVAIWSGKRTQSATEFMTAKNSLGPILVGFLMMSEFFGTGSFIGTPQTAYTKGMYASMAIISLSIGFFFYAFFMAPKYKASGQFTISGILQQKYGKGARYSASLLMIFGLLVDTVSNYTGGSVVLGAVLGVNVKGASFVLAALVSIVVAIGGLRGIGFSNIIHILVKYAAIIIVALTAWNLLRGNPAAQQAIPHKLYTVEGIGQLQLLTYALGNVGAIFATQYLIQSVCSLKKQSQALGASLIASVALIPAGLLGAYIGVAGRGLFPRIGGANVVPAFLTKMEPLKAGFVTAGIVAAAMVSLSALLIGATTLLVKDFYIPIVRPKSQENVLATRVITVVLGLLPLPFVWFVPDILHIVFFSRSLRASIGVIAVFAFYLPTIGRSKTVVVALVGSLVGTTLWFALGNPLGVDNVYVALLVPIIAMLGDAVITRFRGNPQGGAPRAVSPRTPVSAEVDGGATALG